MIMNTYLLLLIPRFPPRHHAWTGFSTADSFDCRPRPTVDRPSFRLPVVARDSTLRGESPDSVDDRLWLLALRGIADPGEDE